MLINKPIDYFDRYNLSILFDNNVEDFINNHNFMVIDLKFSTFCINRIIRSVKLKKLLNNSDGYDHDFILIKNFDNKKMSINYIRHSDLKIVMHFEKYCSSRFMYLADFVYDNNRKEILKSRYI